jgi:lysophospholipase L1-like esterase
MNRRAVVSLLAALVFSIGALGCGSSNPAAPAGAVTVVALGDSITAGFGTTAGTNDYVSRLSSRTGVAIINAGRIGDTTGDALNRLDSTVLSRNPDIVIVFLGGNDVIQSVPLQQRISNITTIAQRIRQRGAAVILVDLGTGVLDAFGGALPGIAAQTTSRYVPGVLEGVYGVPGLMFDAIHPNDAGHAIIADRIEPALRAELAAAGS